MKPNLWQKMFLPDSDPRSIPSIGKKLQRYANAIDYHLTNLKYVLNDVEEIKTLLHDLQNSEIAVQYYESEKIPYNQEYCHLENLMSRWPLAVATKDFTKREADEIEKAQSITDLYIGKHFMEDLKFLDFGCGKGYVAEAALRENPTISIGYDIKIERVSNDPKLIFTNNFAEVEKYKPYDIILAFDVLDHIENEDPSEVVKKLTELLSSDGVLYIRCHPWTSRHATHLHERGCNLAYAHLIFDDIELTRLGGFQNMPTFKTKNPLKTYREWFNNAGLLIKEEKPTYTEIEHFFYRPELAKRIRKHWPERDYLIVPDDILNIEFIDYELTKIKEIL
jgi:2-polyprenyl-3-methyl-5-hydroxy-6-metoxy-1,4-benzoquinol methylase